MAKMTQGRAREADALARRELLRRLLSERAEMMLRHPLSEGQRALWFIYRLDPLSAAYNETMACRLRDRVSDRELHQSIQTLVDRHPALRTTFRDEAGSPVQIVHTLHPAAVVFTDAAAFSDAQCLEVLRQRSAEPFDLVSGPVFRVDVLRRHEAGADILALTAHHIVIDGWSYTILLDELCRLLDATAKRVDANLPPVTATYLDFVRWQAAMLAELDGRQLDAYWRQQLRGPLPRLDLPIARARLSGASQPVGVVPVAIASTISRRLRELAHAEQVTLFTLLVAAFQVLLQRYTGQDDVLIASPSLGRERAEFAAVVGYFVNPIVLRGNLSGDPTFREHLRATHASVLGALEHQALPFSTLVDRLRTPREAERNPIVDVLFVLQGQQRFDPASFAQLVSGAGATSPAANRLAPGVAPLPMTSGSSLPLQLISVPPHAAKLDLELELFDGPNELIGAFKFKTELFAERMVERLARHLGVLLEDIVARTDARLSELQLVDVVETREILIERNRTTLDLGVCDIVHRLVEAQVERTPTAPAVVADGSTLSYFDLDQRANQLAHRLRTAGAGPRVLVAVCVQRSAELVVAMLSVLKAGAAYVPLDPDYPRERLAFMLEDSGAQLVITDGSLDLALAKGSPIVLSSALPDIVQRPTLAPSVTVTGSDPMCVIYTSGSTGKPNGAINTHRGMANRLLWAQQSCPLGATDRVLQKTPISFDVSGWEVFWPLISGATVVVARPGGHRDASYVVETIQRERITTVHFVPSMLRAFLRARGVRDCKTLRRVICSGEALPRDLHDDFFSSLNADLYNLYGPTEAAIDVTAWKCDPLDTRPRVPIGRPIANTQTYVLDEHLRPVPVGAAGELFLGGVGLARGYINRTDLTNTRFIPNPFDPALSDRLYRTGDRVRYLEDGNLDFLGRIDDQVKIRGVRIEPQEIEVRLSEHPSVHQAVVVPVTDRGENELEAYVVPAATATPPTTPELRRHLATRVPREMLPRAFYLVDDLPMTPSGKLDRRVLRSDGDGRREMSRSEDVVGPRTDLERALAAIWTELLSVERVGIRDTFFEIGGNSLRLVEVQHRIRSVLGIEVALTVLFQEATIEALADYLARSGTSPELAPGEHLAEAHQRGVLRATRARPRRAGGVTS